MAKKTATVKKEQADSIALSSENAETLKQIEQNVLKLKLSIADLELQSEDLSSKKSAAMQQVKQEHTAFIEKVREFAVACGINPDSEDQTDQWTLNTATMTFQKVKQS